MPLGLLAGVAYCKLRGLLATPLFFLPSRAISAAPTLSSLRLLGFSVLNSFLYTFFLLFFLGAVTFFLDVLFLVDFLLKGCWWIELTKVRTIAPNIQVDKTAS